MIRHNQPGMDAEVDFGEAWVDLAGERTKCFVFVLRLVYSGKRGAPHHHVVRPGGVPGRSR
ncbi:hypothetical protein ACFYWD_30435 [Streptomyces sp. NPDC003781]|uniref:hypothetical protein n=1 Tax=Streptomyces sp. NPDC003781 TaxID=3364686 RepID=UPI0036958287